jgi:hypothetical protein
MVTRFKGNDTIITAGIGVGGGNSKSVANLLSELVEADYDNATCRKRLPKERAVLRLLQNAVYLLMQKTPDSKYIEAAFDDANNRWHVVQCADAHLGHVERPDIPKSQIVMNAHTHRDGYAIGVSGRGIVRTDQIIYLRLSDIFKSSASLAELNKVNSGYVLVFEGDVKQFVKYVSFADYSNAAAIICVTHNQFFTAASHFNGAFREAGILLLAGKINKETKHGFLDFLKPGEVTNRKVLVYANDEYEEGFLATME